MLADIFNVPLEVPESSCLGATMLGLYVLGDISSLTEKTYMGGYVHSYDPIQENVLIYQK